MNWEELLTKDNLIIAGIGLAALVALIVLVWRRKKDKPPEILDPHERLRHALAKTRGGLLDAIRRTMGGGVNDDVLGSLEEILLSADIGVTTSTKLIEGIKQGYADGKIKDQCGVVEFLMDHLKERLGGEAPKLNLAEKPPTVILVAGVNGCGKTTTIAKLAHFLAQDGKKILLAASDTFRAAAEEQLNTWANRLGVEIVRGAQGADPASVAHDAAESAAAKNYDYLIIDTAGRLHTNKNLMKELEKIARVGRKHIPDSPHEVLLVLDATTGQNAVRQAEAFTEAIDVTGIVLTKLDGTAKGGVVVPIREELGIPVKFVGLGEQKEDLATFDADTFVEALLT